MLDPKGNDLDERFIRQAQRVNKPAPTNACQSSEGRIARGRRWFNRHLPEDPGFQLSRERWGGSGMPPPTRSSWARRRNCSQQMA